MSTERIGQVLKNYRKLAGLSVKEVSAYLKGFAIKAEPNTIYSWESGNSQPTPDALLIMCKMYGIENVLAAFGYKNASSADTADQDENWKTIVDSYNSVNSAGQTQMAEQCEQIACVEKYKKETPYILPKVE